MMFVYKRPPNQLGSILKLKCHLLNEVASYPKILEQWESARTALRNLGYHCSIASWVSLKNDPRVFEGKANEQHGFIFTNDEDDTLFVVTSWPIDEYGEHLKTY